jgi:hypothetical protein
VPILAIFCIKRSKGTITVVLSTGFWGNILLNAIDSAALVTGWRRNLQHSSSFVGSGAAVAGADGVGAGVTDPDDAGMARTAVALSGRVVAAAGLSWV